MNIWTESEIQYLKDNYEFMSKCELSRILNKSTNAIQIKANRMGLRKKDKYYYNKEYFKEISSPTQAYWLGFIYADGYITKSKNSKDTFSIGIELSKKDKGHLKNFNKDIDGNINVTERHRKSTYNDKIIEGNISIIRIYCSEMAKDLSNHGCCLKKSLIKQAPVGVPEEFMRDFIRGYFDGNGTICKLNKSCKNQYRVQIETASVDFLKWLSKYLENRGFENYICRDGLHAYKIHIKTQKCLDFLNYIYKGSERYLNRKYNIYKIAVCEECA